MKIVSKPRGPSSSKTGGRVSRYKNEVRLFLYSGDKSIRVELHPYEVARILFALEASLQASEHEWANHYIYDLEDK